jgi:ATP-dependent helicase/nuclease subunit B
MNDWIDNLERAFRDIALPVREWLQIIEAGLSGLSVGVIPPALDQVLVGSVDRSRNPDLKLALVLGANEGVFPAPPARVALLSEAELEDLETHGVRVGSGRRQFGHERYLGYIALSRARQRVVVSWSVTDEKGNTRNPSRLVEEVKRNFPEIGTEKFNNSMSWEDSQHPIELAGALLGADVASDLQPLRELPQVRPVLEQWRVTTDALRETQLSRATADALYGGELKLSVSALETFAACPFHFFAAYGLGARERDEFEVDFRQMGSFQHEVLSEFHKRVLESGKRWRELKPAEAVQWVREIGGARMQSYEHGLFLADASREFQARALLNNLERVVATLTQWARNNEFEPAAVEVSFGLSGEGWPGWRLDLGNGRSVILRGRVDRVDLLQVNDHSAAVAILDYKSGGKVFDDLKFESGLQLQMPAYLNAICANAEARRTLGASTLNRAGIFYVGLRLRPESGKSREEAIASGDDAAASAFQHRGRFDASFVQQFDNSGSSKGGQFRFSFNRNGSLSKRGNDLLPAPEFAALLDHATDQVRELAGRILSGEARVSPYRKGQEIACGLCPFLAVCRFDSWTQDYRLLKRRSADQEGVEAAT